MCGQFEPTGYFARLSRYGASKIFWGDDVDLLGTHAVVGHVTIGSRFEPIVCLAWFLRYYASKILGVTTLNFWCHVMSSVTTAIGVAIYGFLPVVNLNRPSISHGCWDIELNILESRPFRVTWRHRSRDHWTRYVKPSFYLWNHHSILHGCWDIMCQALSQAYSTDNALIPIFSFRGKIGVTVFYNFVHIADP